MDENKNDRIFEAAVAAGCKPIWGDGIFGWAWHCGCRGNLHGCDQQCSDLTLKSIQAGLEYSHN